jgi:FkbM family methyltransferase
MILKNIADRLTRRIKHRLMVRKWWANGGDHALRFDYDLNEESVVLDLGGYKGQWASDLFSRYRCRIFVFEPVRAFAEQIERRFRKNDRIEVLQYGLGGSSKTQTIHICADASSTFGGSSNKEEIRIVDAKDWISERRIGRIDLIKINIEGGEYELLERLIETRLIEMIENIQVQFHDIAADSRLRMQQIQDHLRTTHEPTYQYEFVWENWARKGKQQPEK